jgi:translation initiation factor IF-3
LGIKTLYEALQLAENAELDLVEVGPSASPPVAKILDYSKYRYELEKKQTKQKKSSEIKEVRLSLEIGQHDWSVKLNQAKKFLADNGRVQVSLKLSGRQMLFASKAGEKINSFREALGAQYETEPQRLGQRFNAVLKS